MTRDKQRKQAARQFADAQGIRYTRALREMNRRADAPPRAEGGLSAECTMVQQKARDVEDRVLGLQYIPAEPVAHRAEHLGQCLSRELYRIEVNLARESAAHVAGFASSGIVDEMAIHHARQVLGHLTRAWAATRESVAEMASDAHLHAVQLLQLTESAMIESCQLAKQVRMSRNEWYCDITGLAQTCSPGARDLRLQLRDSTSGHVMEMPPGCVGHAGEEIVTWTGVDGIEIEVLGADSAAIALARRRANGLSETEHWLLGPQWWEKARTLAPESPFTALFR